MNKRKKKLRRILVEGAYGSEVHAQAVPGQGMVSVLCGWEGGQSERNTEDPVTCCECKAILAYFGKTTVGA